MFKKEVTGTMIYYYFICHRKLWYFLNNVLMEQNSELVKIGKNIDDFSYSRNEKHININDTINIDYFKNKKEIHEIKKSRSIEEASIWQVKYYLFYLENHGVKNIKGKIDYPLLKRMIYVSLEDVDREKFKLILNDIINICENNIPRRETKKSICKKCAYFDLCFI